VTVNCPFECEYLQEARLHDRPAPLDPKDVPNQDIRITDEFVEDHEGLLMLAGGAVVSAALDIGAGDYDVREALDALIRTYRTLQSGVYYETIPANPLAATVYRTVQAGVADFRQQEQQQLGVSRTRDADVLGVLVFLQRVELDRNNGRPRGRAFLDSLRAFYASQAPPAAAAPPSSLILP